MDFDERTAVRCRMAAAVLLAVLCCLGGCATRSDPFRSLHPRSGEAMPIMAADVHSHARPEAARVEHMHFDWRVDFERRSLEGTTTYTLWRAPDANEVILDVKALDIRRVAAGTPAALREVAIDVRPGDEILGDALVIPLQAGDTHVQVSHATTDLGTGLQWLAPSQTAGGEQPFLFSQSQAIHARTIFPCQDTPGVRVTFSADVTGPAGLEVVMSAERTSARADEGRFSFRMEQPIPSYLIAIGAGDLAFRELGARSGVWAEPSVVDRAADEFADTERMIETVEGLYGPYRWERYDILVLPPSFPFGGMENPRLTFATPTILAGDRSLVALIAHELAHSWSGNLVTNATWRDFWLNEGFTVYLEQRIMEALFGTERFRMEVMLSMQDLREELKSLAPRDQILHVELEGRDPDDGFTAVPYDKGAAFLRLLEHTFGRETFDAFLLRYFDAHAFTSITTEVFVDFLRRELMDRDPARAAAVNLEVWIEGGGLPDDGPEIRSSAFELVDAAVAAWKSGERRASDIDTSSWTTHQWLHFLRALDRSNAPERMRELDEAFGLTRSGNSEITCAWLQIVVGSRYEPAYDRLRGFLTEQGRRKFLKPLYKALASDAEMRELGLDIYRTARPLYHAISVQTIDEVLGYEAP